MSKTSIPVPLSAFPPGALQRLLGGQAKADDRPYYTQVWALQAMALAKPAFEGEPQPLHDDGHARNTIRQRFYQGLAFAADHGWPESAKYKAALRVTKAGVYDVVCRRYNPDPASVKWKEDLTQFLEASAIGDSFVRVGMDFSPTDMAWLEAVSTQHFVAEEFDFSYTNKNISIIHREPSTL